jgi:hypothetical protein
MGPSELSSAPAGAADLVIAHGVLPVLERDAQLALLDAARDAAGEEGLVAATVQGELVQRYIGSAEPAAGATLQTEQYARDAYSSAFVVVDFVVGGVGNLYDLVVLRRR